jgi:hypothetical protein
MGVAATVMSGVKSHSTRLYTFDYGTLTTEVTPGASS